MILSLPTRPSSDLGPTLAGLVQADYFKHANDTIVTLAMIETEEAVANADAICATPGLTGIYIGPSDLAITMGKGPGIDPTDPAAVANIEKALPAATKAGIKAETGRASGRERGRKYGKISVEPDS